MAGELSEEEIKKLNDSIKGLAIRTKDAAKKLGETNKEQIKQAREAIREKRQEINAGVKTGKVRAELLKKLEKESDILEERIEQEEKVLEISKKLGDSFIGLGKAAYRGAGNISDFTDNIYGLRTVGRAFDTNIETFRQLSMVGGNFGKSIVDLRLAARDAALPLDDFAKLVGQNADSLAALFGSTTQGAKRIAQLGAATRELGIDRLAPLGFTVDEINETLLLNLDSQRRTNVLNTLTDQQRINSAINFAEQLDRLAKLTGQQRDELRKQIEQQQANERFQAFLQGTTDETRQRLQAFAGTIAGISPDLAEGFQDLIANAGVPVTESALALVQNIPGARAVIDDLISGVTTSEQALVRIRDLSAGSVDRFRQATVTGQVEFLRLQGGIINLGRRVTDTGAVLNEQNKSATSLVSNLTSFEQATKVLSSQFQSIETGLLQAFGPALGKLVGGIQSIMSGSGTIATALANLPGLTAGLFIAGLSGKLLFGAAKQTSIIAAGTRIGTAHLKGGMGGLFGKGGAARTVGGVAAKGVGGLAGLGIAAGGISQAGSAETTGGKVLGVAQGAAGGALTGAMIGSMVPVVGTMIGAAIGGILGAGSSLYAASQNKRAFGGPMAEGQTYLVGERGPEMVTAGTASTVTANQDLAKTFDTSALETKMASMVNELNSANKTLTSMVNGVNTLVAVESRALKAVETSARKDMNQVGMV